MARNPPEGVPQIYPRLTYASPAEAVEWLARAFGLEDCVDARLEAPDGRLIVTEMALGSGRIMIGQAGSHGLESPAKLGAATQMVMVYVDDVDGHCERARSAGAEIVNPLADQPWGDRRYEVLDLEGHRWHFAEHRRDVPPEEWKRAIFG